MRTKYLILFAAPILLLSMIGSLTLGQKPGTSNVVPLRVTIEPTDSSSTACKICSDGLGEYIDGVDGVSASFTKSGWLSVAFQDRATIRTVNFDYSLPSNPPPPPALPVVKPTITSSIPTSSLQDMSYGMTQCIGLGWSHTDGSNITRNHGFQFGPHVSGSSYAIIACTAAANPDNSGQCVQWTVEPKFDGTCNATPSVAGINDRIVVRGKASDNDRGRYSMPFKLTLTKK
ncbi:MAG TPA: hypothetical protein VJ372_17070 [Pyrinomonadaceae bacterium]|jgi:hypothetical protein|nr:hypothetical protein [Pyrinomonadaceae bacterium]